MTWEEVKKITCQKMFYGEDELDEIQKELMISSCNEALKLITLGGKKIRKQHEIIKENNFEKDYNLRDEIENFYQLEKVLYKEDETKNKTENIQYRLEGEETLSLCKLGIYTICYYAYPKKVTDSTSDTYEFELDEEAMMLIPIYMAGQLIADDDLTQSTMLKNEFEARREELKNATSTTKQSSITAVYSM